MPSPNLSPGPFSAFEVYASMAVFAVDTINAAGAIHTPHTVNATTTASAIPAVCVATIASPATSKQFGAAGLHAKEVLDIPELAKCPKTHSGD